GLPAGDIRRGQAVFNSTKAGCFACHGFGYIRGSLGPDLTSVGRIRTERDLLEAIVYPSASFVRSYEPVVVSTKANGKQFGLLREDNLDKIVLATGPNAEVHIPRDEIIELQPGVTSLMPQGFEQILTPQELADVIAFLHAAK
ncbi:MAG: dehydrogenase, partial [Chthoniobacteraceae bacterium]